MNLAVMALVTALIFAEKVLLIGWQISKLTGTGLIIYGVIVEANSICLSLAR